MLQKAGLINSFGSDFFRNRVIFPIHHQSGKVIGFAGRIMGPEQKLAKYINSPETEVYKKAKHSLAYTSPNKPYESRTAHY